MRYFPKILLTDPLSRATATVQCWLTRAKKAQLEAHMATYFLFVLAATDRPSTAGCSQTVQIKVPG